MSTEKKSYQEGLVGGGKEWKLRKVELAVGPRGEEESPHVDGEEVRAVAAPHCHRL